MHLFLKTPTLTSCPKCKKSIKPHTVCMNCGFYNGHEVIDVMGKLTKKERKAREKEIKKSGKEDKSDKPLTMEGLSK